jgi:hypothetical protein
VELVQKLVREGTSPQAVVPVRGVRPDWWWLARRRIEFSDKLSVPTSVMERAGSRQGRDWPASEIQAA